MYRLLRFEKKTSEQSLKEVKGLDQTLVFENSASAEEVSGLGGWMETRWRWQLRYN